MHLTDRQTEELTGYPSIDKPWLKYYSKEAIEATLPECSIYEYLVQNNQDYPSDIAILYLGKKITYKELFENIDKTAAAFIKAGVKEKEIVTVALPSIPEALYCVYALNKIGAVANMIHPLAGKEETLNYFNEVHCRIAVIFDGAYDTIADDVDKTSVERVIVASPSDSLPIALKIAYNLKVKKPKLNSKSVSWKAFIQAGRDTTVKPIKKDCHEMAIISHTGGTTGEPKGCMLSDYNTNSVIGMISNDLEYERQEINMNVLPPFVNYSLVDGMLAPLAFGFQLVLVPKYEPDKFDEYVKKYSFNHLMASIPAYYEPLLSNKKLAKMDLSCLGHLYYGGEKMNYETEKEINEFLMNRGARFPLAKGLGSTEMTSAVTVTYEEINLPDSSGIPLVNNLCKIVDPDTNEEKTYNEIGEICMAGPSLMIGYYQKDEETDRIIKVHADGRRWLHTGDLGRINEDGAVFVTGRIKRIVMTRGNDGNPTKMFPDRIEDVIYTCQTVELSCVIGVEDKERINYPKAFIVLKPDSDEEKAKQDIMETCRHELPVYMIPEEIEFVNDLPRTSRGKVDYRALEEQNMR